MRIKLLATGSHYFVKETCDAVFSSPPWQTEISKPANLYRAIFKRLLLKEKVKRADAWYIVGGQALTTYYDLKLLAAAEKHKTPVVVHWMGTDIVNMMPILQKRPQLLAAIRHFTHWTGAPWFTAELSALGLDSSFMPFPSERRRKLQSLEPPPLPERFSILSYLPDGKPELYGLPHFLRLAKDFPDIDFCAVSGTGAQIEDAPMNIRFLGWIEDILPVYANCSAVVRMTSHDGLSGTVQEALLMGRHVIWTYPFPGVLQAKTYEELFAHVSFLKNQHQQGLLSLNLAGRDHLKKEFEPDALAALYQRRMREVVEQSL